MPPETHAGCRVRDAEYRAALGLAADGKLPVMQPLGRRLRVRNRPFVRRGAW